MAVNNPILGATLNTISLEKIKSDMGPPPWSHAVVLTDHVAGVVIYQNSGQENDNHCHNYDEWWVVMGGKLRWELTGGKIIHAVKGDIVWIPRGTVHHIVTEGDEMSLRFAVAMPPAVHVWQDECENCDVTWEPAKPD